MEKNRQGEWHEIFIRSTHGRIRQAKIHGAAGCPAAG